MVKKLFKHEILAYLRMLTPVYIILCGIAIMSRILQVFENTSSIYDIIFGSSVAIYVLGIVASIILTVVFMVVRFYKNMFSSEGYLTHTLPVTANQHIFVKLMTAILFQFITIITVLISVAIITSGELLSEIIKAFVYIYNIFIESLSAHIIAHIIFYIIEFALMLTVALIAETLLFYAVISVGQLSRKNRVVASIGVYFAYYIITQIIGTVFVVVISKLAETEIVAKIIVFIENNPIKTVHIALIGITLFYALIAAAYYFVTSFIVRKKLNLE